MCDQCRKDAEKDVRMWQAVRLGLIGMQRGLGAIVKAIEVRHPPETKPDNRKVA